MPIPTSTLQGGLSTALLPASIPPHERISPTATVSSGGYLFGGEGERSGRN